MSFVSDVLNTVYPGTGTIVDKLGGLFKDKKQYAIRDQARTLPTADQRAALYLSFIDTLPETGKDNKRNRFNQFYENFPADLKNMSPLMAAEWNRRIDSTSNPSALAQFRASSPVLGMPLSASTSQRQSATSGYNALAAANGMFIPNDPGAVPYQSSTPEGGASDQKDKGNNTLVIILIAVVVISVITILVVKSKK